MAKPESAGQEKDKATKPADATKQAERFSGADHPLAGKDAQQILQTQNKPVENQSQNIFEQMAQTTEKVTNAAQAAVRLGVDATKEVIHDLSKTIQEHGDVAKQIEKSADKVVATAIKQKNTIDRAMGRSESQSKTEAKIINFVYESKKSDTKHASEAIASFVEGGEKSTKSVVDAATHHGDVAKAIEKHADTIVDGLLESKEKIDRLMGKDPGASLRENTLIGVAHGVDKSLVKGAVGILSLAERPNDKDVQFLKVTSPATAAALAVMRNTGDAIGGAWNAAGKYIDHVNQVGTQKAGEEALQSGMNWAQHAKPYDWSEKATDIGTLFVGGYGIAKSGLQGISMLQKMRAAAQVAGVAEATTVGKTVAAGTTGLEATATEGKAAGTVTEAATRQAKAETIANDLKNKVIADSDRVTDESVETLKKGDQSVGKVVEDPFRGEFTEEEIQKIHAEGKRQSTAPMVKKASKIADGENAIPIKDNEIKAAKKKYWDEQHAKPITKGHPPILDIVVGAPGSGKTGNVIGPLSKSNGSFLVEADDMRPLLPGYEATDGGLNYSEAGNHVVGTMASDLMSKSMIEGENVVWATVGKSPEILERAIAAAKEKGYTVRIHLADISPNEAARRCFGRAFGTEGSGQWVDPRYAIQCAEQVPKVFEDLLKSGRFDPSNFFRYDMHVPKGSPLKHLPIEGKKLKEAA